MLPSRLKRLTYRQVIAIGALLLCALALFAIGVRTIKNSPPKVIRMGADNGPPYSFIQPDGSVKGMAVDILNEAARRKNIRLIWIPVTVSPDQALASGLVDAWPAFSRTPERDRYLHFSQPWLVSNYCLISRKRTGFSTLDTTGITLGVAAFPRVTHLAVELFPTARRVPLPSHSAVVSAVCRGEVEAGFLDVKTFDFALLERPEGCGMVAFRVQLVPEATNPVSIASVPKAAAIIDQLRAGITPLITDGTFSAALNRWSGLSSSQSRSYFELREAKLRGDSYFYALILLSGGAVMLIWQIAKKRAAQRRAELALAAAADSDARFQVFMDHSPLAGFVKDEDGRILYGNRRFTEVFERSAKDCIGKDNFKLWPGPTAAEIRKNDLLILAGTESVETIESVNAGNGELSTWLTLKFPFCMAGKKFLGGVSVDITERERAKEALKISEERFRSAFAHAATGMALTDLTGRYLKVNPAFCDITGYTSEELLLMDVFSITHPDDLEHLVATVQTAERAGLTSFRIEKRYIRKDGTTVWARNSIGVVCGSGNQPTNFIALVEDITRERQAGEEALVSEQRWQLALQGTNDGIWDWDVRNHSVFLSVRWKEMLGYEDSELTNHLDTWERLVHPQDIEYVKAALQDHLEQRAPDYCAEYRLRCKDGQYKWVLARGKAIRDLLGNPIRLIGAQSDITERKGAEEQLVYQATHDPLTGLSNRRHFFSRLENEIMLARNSGEPLCVCLCDIDHFKSINDRDGHPAGDEVLVTIARILRESVHGQDVTGRIGGDEFCVLLPRTTADEALACMERIRERLQSVAFGTSAGLVFGVTVSIGIAELMPAMGSAEIIEASDRALYAAKEQGRNTVCSTPVALKLR